MKKLMIAAAVMAAGVAMADGIVSSDVVGYQAKETVSGFNFFTPTFKQVGSVGDMYNINDIELDVTTATGYGDNIQILDEGGATIAQYFWIPAGDITTGPCWSEDFVTAANVDFTSGMSFIVDTAAPVKVTVAGQVLTGNLTVTTVSGFNFIGNASPTSIDIQTIKLNAALATGYGDNIQILDDGGATIAQYFWIPAGDITSEAVWSEDFVSAATYSIDAGLGFIVDTANADVEVTIPMAL